MALRRHTRAFAATERLGFPLSESSLHPENQSAGCFLLGNLSSFHSFTDMCGGVIVLS